MEIGRIKSPQTRSMQVLNWLLFSCRRSVQKSRLHGLPSHVHQLCQRHNTTSSWSPERRVRCCSQLEVRLLLKCLDSLEWISLDQRSLERKEKSIRVRVLAGHYSISTFSCFSLIHSYWKVPGVKITVYLISHWKCAVMESNQQTTSFLILRKISELRHKERA